MAGDLFNMTAMVAPPGGRLVIAGAGMDETKLVLNTTTANHEVMKGHAFSRLSIQDLTFTRAAQTTTQGTVVADEGSVPVLRPWS